MDTNYILVILMFVTFIGLLFTGVPVGYVLGGVALLFSLIGYLTDMYLGTMTGLDFNTLGAIGERVFQMMQNWVLVSIPMFIFMGLMLDQSGLAEKMMLSMQELFGKIRGGLAVTVTITGVILAASTGIIGASVVLLGLLSLPAMLRQGYSKSLATGTVAAAGTLGILIPPSIMLVVMADQLSLPVGDLFMGALLPGVVLGSLYIFYIVGYGLLRPDAAPLPSDRQPFEWHLIARVLKTIIPPASLIVIVLGSIFAGIATPTEASGMGALGATMLALLNGKLNINTMREVAQGTFKISGFIFCIWLGATVFALVMRLLGGDELIEMGLMALPFKGHGIVLFILAAVFFLGFFLDWIEVCLIILPLLAPVVSKLDLGIGVIGGIDNPELVWFTILVAVTLQTSFLTPPVGPSIFFLQGVAPSDIKLKHIYHGVVPFIILQLIGLALIFVWPDFVLWLPSLAYN
jgi:tripartite ATP-independent transporter DctM subunit